MSDEKSRLSPRAEVRLAGFWMILTCYIFYLFSLKTQTPPKQQTSWKTEVKAGLGPRTAQPVIRVATLRAVSRAEFPGSRAPCRAPQATAGGKQLKRASGRGGVAQWHRGGFLEQGTGTQPVMWNRKQSW